MDNTYWVYVLASSPHGTLYVGITNSLERRIAEHKMKNIKGFTATYGVDRLVYFRGFGDVHDAIHFEKQLKRWRRMWKVRLIEEDNPHWADLYLDMMALPPMHPDIAAALVANNKPCHPGFRAAEDREPLSSELAEKRGRQRRVSCWKSESNGSRSSPAAKPG